MTISVEGFKLRFKEFDYIDDTVVQEELDFYNNLLNSPDRLKPQVVYLYTAHSLSVSPFGNPTQRGSEGQRSSYLEEAERLLEAGIGGPFLAIRTVWRV